VGGSEAVGALVSEVNTVLQLPQMAAMLDRRVIQARVASVEHAEVPAGLDRDPSWYGRFSEVLRI
jgi:hypothetical protein